MILKHNYWCFPKALSLRFCNEVKKFGLQHKNKLAVVGGLRKTTNFEKVPLTKKEIKILKKKRNSMVAWVGRPWIYKELHPYVNLANKSAGWNFQWEQSETIQFTYYKKGQYYGWHRDGWESPYQYSLPEYNGKIRKLSCIAVLSDSHEYTGGNLEFDFGNKDKPKITSCKEMRNKGSLIVFPSFLWHRVTPIKTGMRYSLVFWNLGRPFV